MERADRLARDLMVQDVIVDQFAKIAARMLTPVARPDEQRRAARRLIRQVLSAVAEFEKNVILLKLREARERHVPCDGRVKGVKPHDPCRPSKHVMNPKQPTVRGWSSALHLSRGFSP